MTDDEIDDKLMTTLGRHKDVVRVASIVLWPDDYDMFLVRRKEQDFKLLQTMMREARDRTEAAKKYMEETG